MRQEIGEESWTKDRFGEGEASHPGPESYRVAHEGEAEALTGGPADEP